ncbi:hypothetical protein [Mucilaginibacter defluvii]|uniref:Uncharacterized protein n=1 Tax=Mucilaginibacter defluvii TaxID=1196019 RepID=A0ABP9FKZ7_9SPHI
MKELGYTYIKAQGSKKRLYSNDIEGKVLVLKSVNKDSAYFAGNDGNNYVAVIKHDRTILSIIPVAEYKIAQKLYLNKTLWMKWPVINFGSYDNILAIKLKRVQFEPVKVIDIKYGTLASHPIVFILQTVDGSIGSTECGVSITNINTSIAAFENRFYTKDPKLIYKYTPATWANLKKDKVVIGMTEEQVLLIREDQDEVNKVVVGGKYTRIRSTEPKYHSYLFLNGRVTMVKE